MNRLTKSHKMPATKMRNSPTNLSPKSKRRSLLFQWRDRKPEALLDNIKENRARFLKFQRPEIKTPNPSSGKDW